MSETGSDPSGYIGSVTSSSDIGMALLLEGGIADALGSIDTTLATLRSLSARILPDLAQIQTAGADAGGVSPSASSTADRDGPQQFVAAMPGAFGIPQSSQPGTSIAQAIAAPVAPAQAPAPPLLPPPEPMPSPARSFAPAPEASQPFAPLPATSEAPARLHRAQGHEEPAQANPSISFASFAPPATSPMKQMPTPVSDVDPDSPRSASWTPMAPQSWASEDGTRQTPSSSSDDEPLSARTYAPPPTQTLQGGPTGGDVYLDGTRVGTWIADHLGREVARPQMSSTAFDPRLTPAWPGTLQGG